MFRLVLVVVLLFDTQSQVGCLDEEGLALFSFKRSVLEDPEGALGNWNQSDANPCSWNGVTCKDQRVVSLSIPKKKLSGLLPSALGSLSGLRHVNLRSNRFNGALPIQLFQLQGLQSLVLRGNSLSGPLPSVLGKLDYLQTLDLSENLFNGSLPSSILRCKRLRVLDLGANNFTGPLPDGFGANLVSLQTLDLSYNQFNASIPTDLGNLSSLQGTVDLSHNLFSGLIPASLGDLPEKVYIDLTYNSLSGPIPQNGALINRGPTAFIGNPGLCGAPLKTPCSSDSGPAPYPHLPSSSSSNQINQGRGLSRKAVVAIIASDIVGICLVGLLFSYCYTRLCHCGETSTKAEEKGGRKDCLCFTKDGSETPAEIVEQHDLIPLDAQVGFDLDQLLKASAFVLGKSGIGIVYKVVLEDGVSELAVRRLGEGGSQRFKEFQTEVEAVGKLRHPNMVTLRAYYWSVDEKLLIYEYISGGSLDTALHGKPGLQSFTPLPWSTRLSIMRGVAKGLVYLHEFSPKKYVHAQLKASNILLGGESMEAKISDFGLGRLANIAGGSPTAGQSSRRMMSEQVYQAPESVKAVKPSQKWDVYSYGVLLIETVTGRSPLVQEMDLVQWLQHCIDQQAPLAHVLDPCLAQEPDKEDQIVAVLKVAMACVHAGPEKRPTMRHVSEALDRLSNKASD